MRKILLSILWLTLLASRAWGEMPATSRPQGTAHVDAAMGHPSAPQFQDGDRVCFIGDSITHTGTYHAQVMLYYATRFPERRIESYNCGINGGSSGGNLLLRYYEWDVLPHKPTIATLMFGMNDVGRDFYGKDKTGPEADNKRKWPLLGYPKSMTKLSDILTEAKCKMIYLTPSIYDQTGNQAGYNNFGVNDALGICAQECRKLAEKYHAGLVDFHGPMSRINEEQQQKDPAFTIVGRDRIHPGSEGHLVMAYLFLKAQGVPSTVSDISIDAATSRVVRQENCQVTELASANGVTTFVAHERSLPFPLSQVVAAKIEPLVPFTNDLNREMLTVCNLPAGEYKLLLDGQQVLTCTAEELKNGINLATNPNTPQYKQAAAVAALSAKRQQIESGSLRTFAGVHSIVLKANKNFADEEAERKFLQEELDKSRKNNVGAAHIEFYLKYTAAERKKLETDAADLWAQVYAKNKPTPHQFEIRPK